MSDKSDGKRCGTWASATMVFLLALCASALMSYAADDSPIISVGMPLDRALKNLADNKIKVRRDEFGDEEVAGIDPARYAILHPGNRDVFFFIATRPKQGSKHLISTIYLYKDYERDSRQPKALRKQETVRMNRIVRGDRKRSGVQ